MKTVEADEMLIDISASNYAFRVGQAVESLIANIMQVLARVEKNEFALHLVGMGYLQGDQLWNANSGVYCMPFRGSWTRIGGDGSFPARTFWQSTFGAWRMTDL